jgi:segregation and condensation protein B
MFGTTKAFLDYFGLKKLDDLPPLADLSDWESLRVQLNLPDVEDPSESGVEEVADAAAQDLPVLYPEGEEEAETVAETEESASAEESVPEEDEEELVVSQWPDPVV